MKEKAEIYKNGSKFDHIEIVRNKLNCSSAVVRGLCAAKDLDCLKVGGAWYVNTRSVAGGLKVLQKRRSNRNILSAKIRKLEMEAAKRKFTTLKRLIGREIRRSGK
jgi:hypothetical protein